MKKRERLVSGVKPTGDIHIGNYFGAMKQFVDYQDSMECFIFIADYHALNQVHEAKPLRDGTLEIAKAYLAIGLDPHKAALFKQSEVPEHTELAWILHCLTPHGLMTRSHAYKDAVAKQEPVNMGLFCYPILMAADILIYHADVVPVGQDQKQHLEITQSLAQKMNQTYGEILKAPKALILKTAANIPGLDGRKMSKSYGNVLGLFDDPKTLHKKVMSIVTDSKGPKDPKDPATCSIFAYHRLFSTEMLSDLEKHYLDGSISYKESKELLYEQMISFLKPIRERKAELDADPKSVRTALDEGRERARPEALKTLAIVKAAIGVN